MQELLFENGQFIKNADVQGMATPWLFICSTFTPAAALATGMR